MVIHVANHFRLSSADRVAHIPGARGERRSLLQEHHHAHPRWLAREQQDGGATIFAERPMATLPLCAGTGRAVCYKEEVDEDTMGRHVGFWLTEGKPHTSRRSCANAARPYSYRDFGKYCGGRRYARGFLPSPFGVARVCRRAACLSRLTNVGVTNAHSQIIAQVMRSAHTTISLPGLSSYFSGRHSHFLEAQSAHPSSPSQAKSRRLRTMYGDGLGW